MRTTIDIPQDLLQDALRVTRARTKTMVIVLGLQELINRHKIHQLRALRGKVKLTIDIAKSRQRQN